MILYKIFEKASEGYKHFEVSLFDNKQLEWALATAKYYPLEHDENGKKVENILEIKLRSKNIEPFKIVYVQKK